MHTGRRRHNVLDLSLRSFDCYENCEHDILKTKESILMQVGKSGPLSKINFGVRSKVKITRARNRSQKSFSATDLKNSDEF